MNTTSTKKFDFKSISILVACCLCYGGSAGLIGNCFGIFYTPIINDLGFTVKQISFMTTIRTLSSAGFSLLLVRLMKKYKIGSIMSFGMALCILMHISLTFSTTIWEFYLIGILIGVGSSCCSIIPITCIIKDNYEGNSGSIMGLITAISGAVGIIFNPICSKLIVNFGWRISMLFIVLLLLLFALPSAIHLRTAKAEQENINKSKTSSTITINSTFILIALMASMLSISCCFISHISYFGVTKGFSLEDSATMVSFVMVGNIIFKLLLGWVIDHIGIVKSLFIGVSLTAIGAFGLSLNLPLVFMYISCFLYGSIYACIVLGVTGICRELYKNNYADNYSKISVITSLVSALCTTAVGIIYDIYTSYLPIIYLTSLALIISLFCLCILKKKIIVDVQ